MMHIRRTIALLMCLFLLPLTAMTESQKLPLQEAHRVTYTQKKKEENRTSVYWWQVETAQNSVSTELNQLAADYVDEVLPGIGTVKYNDESRQDVNILNSRTGLTWMSFMVQSRYVHNKVTKDVRFTTRTYDMSTGERLLLTDIFPADSEAWTMMADALRERINAYYPELAPDAEALEAACSRESIEQMEFTLHGMSLVLYLHAADFYPGKMQLIVTTLFYPDIRPLMNQKAQEETDNLRYYDTIALTYDDGPNASVTREMLNVLMRNGVRATFFVVGSRLKGHIPYFQREHDEAHSIGTHNYEHIYATRKLRSKLRGMPAMVKKVHEEVIGIAPTYARAPGGQWKPMADLKMGWPLIQWSITGADWDGDGGRDPQLVSNQILARAADGGIILMHDMQRKSVTSSSLFVPELINRGYMFLTIDELFAKDGVELQPDIAYWRCENGVTTEK